MEAYANEWLQLLIRWIHLITGIAWIGSSFYFVFLDNSLLPPKRHEDGAAGVGGELWAVHGGGFYHVQKYQVAPAILPAPLHWFKWEAYSTWLSGFALYVVMYYLHADVYMIDRNVADISPALAIGISLASLIVGWLFYDQLCVWVGLERDWVIALAIVAFLTSAAWGLAQVYSGRAMYLQIGAMLGTLMAANVLFVIIPSQRKLVEATERGTPPDPLYGQRGKQRSVHNNYFTLPVLFIMISNHYPMTFGHRHAWLVLLVILLLAAYVRHFFNLRHRGRTVWAIPVTAALGALALAVVIAPSRPDTTAGYTFTEVQRIVGDRCVSCHAQKPRHDGFAVAPKGLLLETPAQIIANAHKINEQTVVTRAMPIGNLTQMTDAERATLAAWIAAGAPAN